MLFAAAAVLVAIWFFRFGPYGDFWTMAEEAGLNPWIAVALVLLLAAAIVAFRVGLLEAA